MNKYDALLLTYWGEQVIPSHLFTCTVFIKIDDLKNYSVQDRNILKMLPSCDVALSPYAYEMPNYFPHRQIEWVPYSTSIEEDGGRLPLNTSPASAVLVSGSVAWDRPFRQFVFSLNDPRLVKISHPGYRLENPSIDKALTGATWFQEIHKFLCAFCDAHSLRYIHLRVFEVASTGALLLADRLVEIEMNELGFVDGVTCIFCDSTDFMEKVDWILAPANRPKIDRIRAAGMLLALARHTTRIRAAEIASLIDRYVEDAQSH